MILLEVGNLDGLIIFLFGITFGPPILLFLIGSILHQNGKKNTAKAFFTIALVYLIIGGGLCLSFMV